MTRGQVFELAFWTVFAAGAFALSFQFDRPIEIYAFGASGWPRAIVLLIVLAVVGQYVEDRKRARSTGPATPNASPDPCAPPRGFAYFARVAAIMGVPLAYAFLLEPVGFYALTPVFIVTFLLLGGERRPLRILLVTALLYGAFLLLFAKLLYVGLPTGNLHPFYDFSNWLLVKLR